ncbi:MAG: cell division protein SepF [Actinomycetota bacterium]
MVSAWKKTLGYLGLVEEDEDDFMAPEERVRGSETEIRRFRPAAVRSVPADPEPMVRTMAPARATAGTIHRSEPKRYNDAEDFARRFREGVPVIMNLQNADDTTGRRLIDFASGLVFALDGRLEIVASRVYLLTPPNVEVSAEDRERLAGGGFFNQF